MCRVTGLKTISNSELKMPSIPSFLHIMVDGGLLSTMHLNVAGSFLSSKFSNDDVSTSTVGGSEVKEERTGK